MFLKVFFCTYTWQLFQNSVYVQVCLQILLQPLIIITASFISPYRSKFYSLKKFLDASLHRNECRCALRLALAFPLVLGVLKTI